jgi:hypothetical protein
MWKLLHLLGNLCESWGNRGGPSSSRGEQRRFGMSLTPLEEIEEIEKIVAVL